VDEPSLDDVHIDGSFEAQFATKENALCVKSMTVSEAWGFPPVSCGYRQVFSFDLKLKHR
jgi:hypothetical protein